MAARENSNCDSWGPAAVTYSLQRIGEKERKLGGSRVWNPKQGFDGSDYRNHRQRSCLIRFWR